MQPPCNKPGRIYRTHRRVESIDPSLSSTHGQKRSRQRISIPAIIPVVVFLARGAAATGQSPTRTPRHFCHLAADKEWRGGKQPAKNKLIWQVRGSKDRLRKARQGRNPEGINCFPFFLSVERDRRSRRPGRQETRPVLG